MAPIRWRAPGGFPIEIGALDSAELPSFAGRATDPSLGAPLPDDAQLHPSRLHFRGYHSDTSGATFRYDLDLPEQQLASFTERLSTSADEAAGRIERQFEFATPGPKLVTLLVADSAQPIQAISPGEKSLQIVAAKDAPARLPAEAIFLIAEESGAGLYRIAAPTNDAHWRVIERDGRWQVLLQLPTIHHQLADAPADPKARASLSLEVVLPTDNSAEAIARQIENLRK
jgi:hypothetical protein